MSAIAALIFFASSSALAMEVPINAPVGGHSEDSTRAEWHRLEAYLLARIKGAPRAPDHLLAGELERAERLHRFLWAHVRGVPRSFDHLQAEDMRYLMYSSVMGEQPTPILFLTFLESEFPEVMKTYRWQARPAQKPHPGIPPTPGTEWVVIVELP